jgi:hypothetical protein
VGLGKRKLKSSSRSRCQHLLKTFWGWRDRQLPDGIVIWRLPAGQTYVTTAGSVLRFPGLWERQDKRRPGTRNTDNPNRPTPDPPHRV